MLRHDHRHLVTFVKFQTCSSEWLINISAPWRLAVSVVGVAEVVTACHRSFEDACKKTNVSFLLVKLTTVKGAALPDLCPSEMASVFHLYWRRMDPPDSPLWPLDYAHNCDFLEPLGNKTPSVIVLTVWNKASNRQRSFFTYPSLLIDQSRWKSSARLSVDQVLIPGCPWLLLYHDRWWISRFDVLIRFSGTQTVIRPDFNNSLSSAF